MCALSLPRFSRFLRTRVEPATPSPSPLMGPRVSLLCGHAWLGGAVRKPQRWSAHANRTRIRRGSEGSEEVDGSAGALAAELLDVGLRGGGLETEKRGGGGRPANPRDTSGGVLCCFSSVWFTLTAAQFLGHKTHLMISPAHDSPNLDVSKAIESRDSNPRCRPARAQVPH